MTIETKPPPPWISATRIIVLASPALTIFILIFVYGVNVPFADQWDEVPPLIEKMHKGTLGLSDFFAQHNEHRLFFPRLIMLGLALLTRWNIKVELFTSWVLACICAYNLWRMSRVTGFSGSNTGFWSLFAANVLLFTPLQSENWLWGFQIGFFLPVAALTSLLWMVPSSRTSVAFPAAIVFSIIGNFSIASGFIFWLLALLLLLLPHGRFDWQSRKSWLILFFLIFIGAQILYLRNYQKPAHHPDLLMAIRQLREAMDYILAYFGSAFALGTAFSPINVAMMVGASLVILFGICVTYVLSCRKDHILVERSLPWIALCLFSISTNILTTIGRMGFGTTQALSSRYVIFSALMPIGLLFLMHLVYSHWRERTTSGQYLTPVRTGIISVTAILGTLLMLSSLASLRTWAGTRRDRIYGKAVIELINVIDDSPDFCKYVYPAAIRKETCNEMARLGYLHPRLMKTRLIREIAKPTPLGESASGYFDELTQSRDGYFTASGWSVLPERKEAAVATLLTYDDDHGQANIFAMAMENTPRPDVVRARNTQGYSDSGWSCTVETKVLPPGRRTIRAWAFDPEACRAYELSGTKLIATNL
jgi:hypothetical protein